MSAARRAGAARPRRSSAGDLATRKRVLAAATHLFAERGFRRVTVRDICSKASANVASVNYHFGDKQRLYLEVVDVALAAVRGFADQAMSARPGAPAEEQLRHYVHAHLVRAPSSSAARRAAVIRELFRHELAEPTGAAGSIVEQALRPRLRYLGDVVGALLGTRATAEAVRGCVMSIQAQCFLPLSVPSALTITPPRGRADLERLAEHIVQFSLAGIRACKSSAR